MTEITVETLETRAAATLRYIARNEAIEAYVLESEAIYSTLLRAVRRFLEGEILPQCIETVRTLNQEGFVITIDYMGESTRYATQVQQATEEFLSVVRGSIVSHDSALLEHAHRFIQANHLNSSLIEFEML